ncbi:hypothetical protein BJP36_44035 [Moorena producens JHB]|uniref:Uncharacterized protein n=1 Tax=Moorena producens (strain JHB) TaxID=1454205 RepID=A0A9Q9UVZ6_MOOP1|nr:hypothetical protein [Moorena producens]WAN69331.1 hypothetical protein BJP36_44035 [Moorena producens JHB]
MRCTLSYYSLLRSPYSLFPVPCSLFPVPFATASNKNHLGS